MLENDPQRLRKGGVGADMWAYNGKVQQYARVEWSDGI